MPCLHCPDEIRGCLLYFKFCMARLTSTLDHLCCTAVFYVTVLWINTVGWEKRKGRVKAGELVS